MDNIDITPKSQLLDSSITKITPAIGVPITEAPTDAIPHNAKALKSVAIPKKLIKLAKTIPDAAPTNNAGEKTPPKKPVDKQTAVRIIFRKRKGDLLKEVQLDQKDIFMVKIYNP